MTGFLREYLLSIVAGSLLSTVMLALVPKGSIHRTLQFVCGLLLLLVTISPVVQLELAPLEIPTYVPPDDLPKSGQDVLMMELIKTQAETYIWDKANAMGCDLDIQVEVAYNGSYGYPEKVSITGDIQENHREILEKDLENNLAIPKWKQEWHTDG